MAVTLPAGTRYSRVGSVSHHLPKRFFATARSLRRIAMPYSGPKSYFPAKNAAKAAFGSGLITSSTESTYGKPG